MVPPAVREEKPQVAAAPLEDVRRKPKWHDDSLSSLSIESEDDNNLLSQVNLFLYNIQIITGIEKCWKKFKIKAVSCLLIRLEPRRHIHLTR